MIKVLISEDEQDKMDFLTQLVNSHPKAHVECQAGTVAEVEQMIREYQPQLAFLDVELYDKPVYLALEKIKETSPHLLPDIVFVTAHKNQHAPKLLNYTGVTVIDKPYVPTRIKEVIDEYLEHHPHYEESRILIPNRKGTLLLRPNDIVYCKGAKQYTEIHKADGSEVLATGSIGQIHKLLPSAGFFKPHNSYIINLEYMEAITDGMCQLKHAKESVPLVPDRKQELLRRLR